MIPVLGSPTPPPPNGIPPPPSPNRTGIIYSLIKSLLKSLRLYADRPYLNRKEPPKMWAFLGSK